MEHEVDVAVIGAGQAGLSSGYFLRRAGFTPNDGFVILDREERPGGAWQHRWRSLTFDTVHGIYQLPGKELTEPSSDTPVVDVVPDYFNNYERAFDLDVQRPVRVHAVTNGPADRLRVETDAGVWVARALINATGTWTKPFWPYYPGQELFQGRQLHTADYRGHDEFAGKRVAVVGGGASAIQQLIEIAEVAAQTTWVTRRPPTFTSRPFDIEWGRAVEAAVADRVRRGLPPESVVKVTGYPLTPPIAAARKQGTLDRLPMFDRIAADGVSWDDGRHIEADVIVWGTGFRAALDHLAPLGLRRPGGGIAVADTAALDDPRIYLVGYGPSASTIGANRAGRVAVRQVQRYLAETARPLQSAPAPELRASASREVA